MLINYFYRNDKANLFYISEGSDHILWRWVFDNNSKRIEAIEVKPNNCYQDLKMMKISINRKSIIALF